MADSIIVSLRSTFFSDLSLGSQHDKKRVCDSHCHSLSDYEWDCAWWWQLVWLFDIHEPLQVAMMALSVAIIFFIISLYSWTKGNREAQKLNQCLKKRNDNES